VQDVAIHSNYVKPEVGVFARVEGEKSQDISLFGNDLHRAKQAVVLATDTPADAVRMDGQTVSKGL
jgi:hypothetical protein